MPNLADIFLSTVLIGTCILIFLFGVVFVIALISVIKWAIRFAESMKDFGDLD